MSKKKGALERDIEKAIATDPYLAHARKFSEGVQESIIDDSFESVVAGAVELVDDESLTAEERQRVLLIAEHKEPKHPKTITRTVPGSAQRLRVYSQRYSRGEAIFHSEDTNLENVKGGTFDRVIYSGYHNRQGRILG